MPFVFPNKTQAENLYRSAQDHLIDNYGKDVMLYYPTYLSGSAMSGIGPGNMGDHFMFGGDNVFEPGTFLNGSGQAMLEIRPSGQIKLLCTLNSKSIRNSFESKESINIKFVDEKNYIYSKGYMRDFASVSRCEYAVFHMPSGIDHMKFRLLSKPTDRNSIVQGRYFVCWWEQIN